jgi:hypothetical protein
MLERDVRQTDIGQQRRRELIATRVGDNSPISTRPCGTIYAVSYAPII